MRVQERMGFIVVGWFRRQRIEPDRLNMGAKLNRLARSVFTPTMQDDLNFGNSATLNAQIWLGQFPWRPTAAWAVVAALFSIGLTTRRLDLNWQTAALLLLLVDPLWGSIWRLAAGRSELLPLHTQAIQYQVWLPYLRRDAPAARLLGWDNAGAFPLLFRVALPSLLLAGAVALVLGMTAVWMTLLVALVSRLGWISRRVLQLSPAFLHSVVTVALPWALAINLFAPSASGGVHWKLNFIFLVLLVVHNWGEGRSVRLIEDLFGLALLAVAEAGLILLFVFARAPLWLVPLVVLWLPAWLAVYHKQPLQRANVWWLLAMLVSSFAIGQINY
ncbi:MAG: hypothetical protein NT075_37740 [Chloroflexi bacterium]|nr:hypothetical protein [Chloroflexota bacterium]